MISHADLAEIAQRVYQPPWSGTAAGDVRWSLLPRDGETVVALPGTHPGDPLDWLRDVRFLPVWQRGLGPVHAGFGDGARAAWRAMKPSLPTDKLVTFTAHSLGGALALCLGALHAYDRPGIRFRVVTFAAPRPAFLNPWFHHLLAKAEQLAIYSRRGDVVPNLPFPPWYLHGGRQTMIGTALDDDPIGNHSISLYAKDLKALGV